MVNKLDIFLVLEVYARVIHFHRFFFVSQRRFLTGLICEPQCWFPFLHADDILIFCKGSLSNVRCLLDVFNTYAPVSSQVLSPANTKIFPGSISHARLLNIAALFGFHVGTIPLVYLGFPIFVGKPKVLYFQAIVDQIKLATWKGTLLSIIGRFQLVKSII
jgi:hypothetical protein